MRKYYTLFIGVIAFVIANAQPPVLVKDIYPGSTGSNIGEIVKTSNYSFLTADDDDADADRGLFRTDGTTAGTIKLDLTYPGYVSTKAECLVPLGDKIIFVGDNYPGYYEIWSSDGTQAGTIALERFQPANRSSFTSTMPTRCMAVMGNYVYYCVNTNDNHVQLRRTDGSPGGTSLVKELDIVANGFGLYLFNVINNVLYFVYYKSDGTDNLWRSDGTEAGTQLVKAIPSTSGIGSSFMPAGDYIYFLTIDVGPQVSLWKSDGTTAGTNSLKTISTVTTNNFYPPNVALGSTLYFTNTTSANGKELWKTDGTDAGTTIAADINPGAASSTPLWLTIMHNKVYFSATDGVNGNELWKYDGTAASMVTDIYPGAIGSMPSSLVVSNNVLYFAAASDNFSGNELWVLDDLLNFTIPILPDINFAGSSSPSLLTAGSPPIFFTADNGTNGKELYSYHNPLGCVSLITSYRDADADGYGTSSDMKQQCFVPSGYVTNNTDCNDNDATIYPGAPELCDGKDNNCNASVDESCVLPNVTIEDISANESQGTATVKVSLSYATNREVSVSYRTVDGTAISNGPPAKRDFTKSSGRLIFVAGSTAQNIIVSINQDNTTETDEYFDIELTRATEATITDGLGRVTISNGSPTVIGKRSVIVPELPGIGSLSVNAFPNPTQKSFTIIFSSNNKDEISLIVTDMSGRKIETRNNLRTEQAIRFGDNYQPGVYVVEIIQGANRKKVKLVKL